MTRRRARWALLALVCAALPAAAQVGGFGQNKIQYRPFDWHVLAGEHVDVYFYPAEDAIARMALVHAEESIAALEREFTHIVRERIPLIVYASHSDFEQTNVLPFVPPEGILGVTEFLKRRVALPFRGSYAEFRHTLRHELVHVFELSLLAEQSLRYPRARRPPVPLWWSEGLAELLSGGQDARDEMIVRDLTLAGRLPSIDELGTATSTIVYPVGGDLHAFLAARFGSWRIPALYADLWKAGSFAEALEGVYGIPIARLTEEWHHARRQRWYPTVAGRTPLSLAGERLAELALKPVAMRHGQSIEVAYLSPSSGYTNVYLLPLDRNENPRVVVEGERSPQFESLHPFSSRIDGRNRMLIFASKFGDRDALFFWDVDRRAVAGRYRFPGLVGIRSPSLAPDGRRVAFSALSDSGVSDLYVLDTRDGHLTRVTADRYEDLDPTWLPTGQSVVYASDRAVGGAAGTLNLFRVNLDTRETVAMTAGRWRDESPRWDPSTGRVIFVSDRSGKFELLSVDTLGVTRRESDIDGAFFDPAPIPGDDRVLVTGFHAGAFGLYAIRLAPDSASLQTVAAAPVPGWDWTELGDRIAERASVRRYRRQFSLDFAAGVAAGGPGSGAVQGAQLVLSDLLGDHVVAVSAATYQARDAGDLFANLNANVLYLNQSRRINWGAGAFRVAGTFVESDLRQLYRETSGGVYGIARYPLSRFTRIEGQVSAEHSTRDDFGNALVRGEPRRRGILTGNYLGVASDNALWLQTGPIDGGRWSILGGVVSDVTHGTFENWVGQADVRRYFRTSTQAAIALRAYGYVSDGVRPRAIQIAGSWMLRGYPRYSLSGTHAWLTNAEWRFPITHYVTLGFPFGVVRLPQLQGATFMDLGQVWNRGSYDPRVLGAAGVGFRTALVPGLVLRLDVGRRFSLAARGNPEERAYYHRRFADLFFGYNY